MTPSDSDAGTESAKKEEPPRTAPPVSSPSRLFVVPLLLLLFLGTCLYSPTALEQLLLGWLYFPIRVIPQMTVDWPSVIAGAIAVVAFVIGLHLTLCWLFRYFPRTTAESTPHKHWRTTGTVAFVVLLLFAAGTAMVGATHQVVWLISGRATRSDTARAELRQEFGVQGPISSARANARRSQQKNNLKQIGLAIHNFHSTYDELPPGGIIDVHGKLMHGWAIFLGGFAGYSTQGIDFSKPWNVPPNDRLYRCAIPDFINPSISEIFDKGGYGLSHVAGNANVLRIARIPQVAGKDWEWLKPIEIAQAAPDAFRRNLPLRISDITDGASNTLLIGDAAGNFKAWGHPANVRDPALGVGQSLDGFGGPPGQGGAQFVLCDGSVRFISDRVDRKIMKALGTPTGGESIPAGTID